jgi:sacsin
MGITSSAALAVLPVISGRVSLDLRNTNPDILRFIQPSDYQPLSVTGLLELGVQNFPSQPPEIRTRIVTYIAADVQTKKGTVPLNILASLSQQPFLVAQDDSVRMPKDIVDPESHVSEVFNHFPRWMPRMKSRAEEDMIEQLRKLQSHSPLRKTMDRGMLLEVTEYISTRGESAATREEAIGLSRKLLKLLAKTPQYTELVKEIPRERRWIVTNLGLKAMDECRDRNAQSALFDEVLPLLEDHIPMTDMLRGVFGWNSRLHHQVLFCQLDLTLKKGAPYKKVREIVKEIGQYELSEEGVVGLKKLLGGRDWVPTKKQSLVKTANAVFTNPIDSADLFEVSFNDVDHPQVLAFLKRMGCEER